MKSVILSLVMFSSALTHAAIATCKVDSKTKKPLIVGKEFSLIYPSGLGLNGNFGYRVMMTSSSHGYCEGLGTQNQNPSTQGFVTLVEMSGAHCVTDGFSLYLDPHSKLVQINHGAEAVIYHCTRTN